MDKRLKQLKQKVNKQAFNSLKFTSFHKRKVKEAILRHQHSEGEILVAIMQLLVSEQNGYELCSLIRSRGIFHFENNEGALYVLLHELESRRLIDTRWSTEEIKYYYLNQQGKKALKKTEKRMQSKKLSFHEILEG